MYVKTNNGVIERFPYTIGDLRKENSNTSFPRVMSDELLAEYGVFSVTEQEKPSVDRFSYCVKKQLPQLVNGKWVLLWDTFAKSAEELAEEDSREAQAIRDSRDGMLAATDWTQVDDAPVDKAAWAVYRQALRDVPSQNGFPWNVTWPTKPE